MSRRPHQSAIRWTAICCFILAPLGYGQWNVPIDHVNLPVQNYAVIDLSGTVQGGNDVTMVALDDRNNAAFAFTAGTNLIPGLDPLYIPIPPASAQAYTWRNGSLGSCQYTDLTTGPAVLPNAYNYNRFLAYVWGVDTNGTIYGTVGNMYIMDGQNYPQGQISCLFSSSGGAYATHCPSFPPYWGVDDSGNALTPYWGGVTSSNGSLIYNSVSSFGFTGGPYISSNGQFTVFYPPDDGFQPSVSPWTVQSVAFTPTAVNNNGATVGFDGVGSLSLWSGNGQLVNIGASQNAQGILNDQNQVAVDQPFSLGVIVGSEGYLWENGASSIFRLDLPALAQWQIQGIQPFLISNQAAPNPPIPLAPDLTIHILTATQDNGASETMLCTRDNNGKWSFAKVQLPAGVNITSFKTINSSGVIAAIGTVTTANPDGSTSISAKKALLLVPVQFAVAVTLKGAWNATTATLSGYQYNARATVPAFAGISIGGIWRDIQATDTWTFKDGSTLFCGCGWLSDSSALQVNGIPDGLGNLYWPGGDAPAIPAHAINITDLNNVTEVFNARWFIVLQIGGSPTVVAECDTKYTNAASWNYSGGSPFFQWNATSSKSLPPVNSVAYGSLPTHSSVAQRNPSLFNSNAVQYFNVNSHWKASGGLAKKYQPNYP